MNESSKIAEQIGEMLPHVKRGTLRFWGVWFGRPHDNVHGMVKCHADGDILTMRFNENEILTVWFPNGLKLESSKFQIADAERVRLEWFSYGDPQTEENRLFYDFKKTATGVVANTNTSGGLAEMRPKRWLPAVEIV